MQAIRKCAVIGLFVLGVLGGLLLWLNWSEVLAYREIQSGIHAIRESSESSESGIPEKTVYRVNTYDYDLSSERIKGYYNRAAAALGDLNKDSTTIRWHDSLGWDRVSTFCEIEGGYLEVRGSCNNDNDSVSIAFYESPFLGRGGEVLLSYEMPFGVLRCDWQKQD